MKTREDRIKEAYEADNTLDPSSVARGWALHEQHLAEKSKLDFDLMRPKKWRNRGNGKIMRVMPLWIPLESQETRMDFNGLLKDLAPEMGDLNAVFADRPIYSGLMMQEGVLIENHNRCWIGLMLPPATCKELFEDLGFWDEEKDRADEMFKPDVEVKDHAPRSADLESSIDKKADAEERDRE